MIACNENNIDEIKKCIQRQTTFLQKYDTIVNLYTLDYFVCDHWQKIPSSWQSALLNFEVQDLGRFLDVKEEFKSKNPLPLSLVAFRAAAYSLSLPRYTGNSLQLLDGFLHNAHGFKKENIGKYVCEETDQEIFRSSSQHKDLPTYCRRHVKLKKQHEICRLSQLINLVLKKINVSCVMDIGSGLGHLSRLLCLKYNLKVATIEAESGHISVATNFDKEAFANLRKTNKTDVINQNETPILTNDSGSTIGLPQHLKGLISLNSSFENLQKIIKQAWVGNDDAVENLQPFALLGLHTCGDLAATLQRIFIETPQARALLSVGCCYMKLSTGKSSCGFPLSSFVNKLPISLSSEAREVACHALEKYIKRLKENGESLKIHCYRAILEKIIVKHSPSLRHLGLRGVKHAEKLKFHEYAAEAIKNISVGISKDDLDLFTGESYLKEWKNVVAIYSLRLLIAPVIESLILLDRMVFLYENGLKSCIFPIFNPSISPRNHLLFSVKCG